jgi:hypothetical protein
MSRWETSVAIVSLLVGCGFEQVDTATNSAGSATPLGYVTTETAADPLRRAELAFEHDAYRREARFMNAAAPGWIVRASRPDSVAIDEGVYSPDALFQLGGQLFLHDFTVDEGLGGDDAPYPRRVQLGFRGGPEATSCRACHWRGGLGGAGDAADTVYLQGDGRAPSSGLARNAPALVGAGYVELLAREMTRELAMLARAARAHAEATGQATPFELRAKGVAFGTATARPDGSLDVSSREGLDGDLVVRPFGQKGNLRTLRDAVDDALAIHLGLQSDRLIARDGDLVARVGPHGGGDPDGDGVRSEISDGQLDVLTLFAAMQAPGSVEMPNSPLVPTSLWATGRARFESIGCADCHTPALPLDSTIYDFDDEPSNRSFAIDLSIDGAPPRLTPSEDGRVWVELYSDLKRHDLGDALAESRDDRGTSRRQFITRPLWGLARSRPYLHDGRAPTIHDAIVAHGGEAQAARDAYVALGESGQAPIRVFLTSLSRPPTYVAH